MAFPDNWYRGAGNFEKKLLGANFILNPKKLFKMTFFIKKVKCHLIIKLLTNL